MVPKFYGQVDNGKLRLFDREDFDKYLLSVKGPVELSLKRRLKQRTIRQNRYYWGVIVKLISEHTGFTPTEVHNLLKYQFLKDIMQIGGKTYGTIKSTTELDTQGFSEDYWEPIRQWAAEELNLFIPDPSLIDE